VGGQGQAKPSKSKLLATTTANNQLIVEGPTKPKKLEKDAKLLFPSQNSGKKPSSKDGSVRVMTRQNMIPPNLVAGTRRNSEYQGSHLVYQVKTVRDVKEVG